MNMKYYKAERNFSNKLIYIKDDFSESIKKKFLKKFLFKDRFIFIDNNKNLAKSIALGLRKDDNDFIVGVSDPDMDDKELNEICKLMEDNEIEFEYVDYRRILIKNKDLDKSFDLLYSFMLEEGFSKDNMKIYEISEKEYKNKMVENNFK